MKKLYSLAITVLLLTSNLLAQNCGVIYVTPNGASSGSVGTQTNPADLEYGITLLSSSDSIMYLSTGTHSISSTLTIPSDVTLEGGFDPVDWSKSNASETIIERDDQNIIGTPYHALVAIEAVGSSGFRLQDLTVAIEVVGVVPQLSLYGIYLSGCSDYDIVRCKVMTADAGSGNDGTSGEDGMDGSPGSNGAQGNGDSGSQFGAGGNGGAGGGPNGGAAGNGATSQGTNGGAGQAPPIFDPRSGGGGGGGASGGTGDNDGGNGGIGAGPSGNNTSGGGKGEYQGSTACNDISNCNNSLSGNPGGNGGTGADGADGQDGTAGQHTAGYWVPGGFGTSGSDGEGGQGGRGGGGGGGEDSFFCDEGSGSGGGGGGGGGRGGTGGSSGTGGGSAYAIYLQNNGTNGNITDCELLPGAAGSGGTGGTGGTGGDGGTGGTGGNWDDGDIGCGGDGGDGGKGGDGGAGGDGKPGESQEIYEDPNGEAVNANGTANVPGNPPTITVDNPGCTNATVVFEGNSGGAWDFGSGASPATASGAGPHSVSYSTMGRKDIIFAGTSFTEYISIINQGSPTSNTITASATSTPFNCPIDFTTTATGTSYSWDFGNNATPSSGNTQSVSGVSFSTPFGPRTVYVTVTTACCGDVLDSIEINVTPNNLSLSVSPGTTVCAGEEVTLSATPGYSSYIFQANNSPIQTGTDSMLVSTSLQGGVSYTVQAINQTCTLNSNNIVLQVEPSPSVDLGSDQQVCGQSIVTLDAGSGPSSYLWSDGSTTQTVDVQTGQHWVEVSNGTCTDRDTIEITASSSLDPEVMPSGTTTVCDGTPVTLDAGSGYASYLWSNGETTQTISVSQSGSFSVYVVDTTGCDGYSDTAMVDFNSISVPVLSPAGPLTICDGDTVILDAGGGYDTYVWSNGDTTQTTEVTAAGNYYATVTQGNCVEKSDTVLVDVETVDVTISQDVNDLSATPANCSSYQWYFNFNPISGATGSTHTMETSGTYYVVATCNGCEDQSNFIEASVVDGVTEQDFAQSFSLYPNPNNGNMFLEMEFDAPVDLIISWTNPLGQKVQQPLQLNNVNKVREQLSLSEMPRGMYFLTLEKNGERLTKAVVRR